MTIPNNLKKYREICGYTQIQVAKIIGHAYSNRISHWEKGIRIPSLMNLLKLSRLYSASVEVLYQPYIEDLFKQS